MQDSFFPPRKKQRRELRWIYNILFEDLPAVILLRNFFPFFSRLLLNFFVIKKKFYAIIEFEEFISGGMNDFMAFHVLFTSFFFVLIW